jgi:hypothetical protein
MVSGNSGPELDRMVPMNIISPAPVLPGVAARCAVVAQLVEQLIRNQQVTGSSPVNGSSPPPATPRWLFFWVVNKL